MSERQEQYNAIDWDGVLALLAVPFPAESHKELPGKKGTYVSWHHYIERLNEQAPGWSMDTAEIEVAGKLIIKCTLTIGGVSRVNYGNEDADKDSYGTAVEGAMAQALKRTCAMFGLGLYLYDEDARQAAVKPQPTKAQQKRAASSEVQADKSTEPLVRPDGWAAVTVTHPDWPGMQDWLCKKTSYYMQDGEPNPYHMLATLAKEGITEVSEENAKKVLAVLLGYAEKN